MYVRKVSPHIRNRYLNHHIIGKVVYLFFRVVAGPIKMSIILLQYTYNLSISARQSRNRVSAFTTWKLTKPIRVLTATDLIDTVKPMPNWTFTAPVCVISISALSFVVALYTKYCLQPAVDFLEALVSIITPQNSLGLQRSVVMYANGFYL